VEVEVQREIIAEIPEQEAQEAVVQERMVLAVQEVQVA
jgi:hypothetical protein